MQTNEAYRVLVIDDNPDIHEVIRKILAADDSQASALAGVEAQIMDTPA
jgi:CheY-like chemotaxis protein